MPKKNSTPSNPSMQMSLFDALPQEDNRPLPELIASGGSDWATFPLAYVDVDRVRYYAVQDWIAGVALSQNAARFWTDMQKRLKKVKNELYASCVQLPYLSTNGKTYQLDHATAETLYAITQRMDATTGIRDHILAYLAKAGVTLDEYRLNPSMAVEAGINGMLAEGDPVKTKARVDGIIARVDLVNVAKATHYLGTPNYAALTAHEYLNLFGRSKSAIVQELNLDKTQAAHFRDHLNALALRAIEAAEATASMKMQQLGRLLTDDEQIGIVIHASRIVAPAFRQMAEYVGVDLVTAKPLLGN